MEHLHSLMELGKDLDVLYIEDDQTLQNETKKILERIFKSVDVAPDGQQGLDAFSTKTYDLLITDIEMPNMDGLTMSRHIKKLNDEIPIVVVSAYSNTDYLLDAISIGINYYILKPIKMPRLIDTLFSVVKRIIDKKLADEYRQKEINETISRSNEKILAQITNISPNPVILYKGNSIVFINTAFKNLFEADELKVLINNELNLREFLNQKMSVDQMFKNKNDFIEHLDDFSSSKEETRSKISIKTRNGRKIYLVIHNQVEMSSNEDMAMFTFNDITVVEYQRFQIDQYNEYMSDLTYTKYKTEKGSETADIIDRTTF